MESFTVGSAESPQQIPLSVLGSPPSFVQFDDIVTEFIVLLSSWAGANSGKLIKFQAKSSLVQEFNVIVRIRKNNNFIFTE